MENKIRESSEQAVRVLENVNRSQASRIAILDSREELRAKQVGALKIIVDRFCGTAISSIALNNPEHIINGGSYLG